MEINLLGFQSATLPNLKENIKLYKNSLRENFVRTTSLVGMRRFEYGKFFISSAKLTSMYMSAK